MHVWGELACCVVIVSKQHCFGRSFILFFVVTRAKPCLDFSLTVFVVHLFIVWLYNGSFPLWLSWWILNAICVTIMCVGGEYLSLNAELKSIPLLVSRKDSSL